MNVRKGEINEFEKLWAYSETHTYKYFLKGLKDKNIEFWTIDNGHALIGELYIFWNSEDQEEANGSERAYLCALRIAETYQGQGLSSLLMKAVIKRIKERGFKEVTIGIDNDNYDKLLSIYEKWGFEEHVKEQSYDYHYFDQNNQAYKYPKPIDLYLKKL